MSPPAHSTALPDLAGLPAHAASHAPSQTTARAGRPRRALLRPASPFFRRRAFGWTALVLLLLVWEVAAGLRPSPGLPAPSRIGAVWLAEMQGGDLAANLRDTLTSMAWGYAIAAVVGLVLGVLMARVRVVYALLEPFVELLRPIPTIVFIPVIILYLGLGREMNVFAIVLSAVEPILIASYSGARAVPAALRDTAASFGLGWWRTLREIVVPAAAPQIFVGLRLALASSLVLAIASGMIAGNSGIGFYILNAQQTLDIARMYAGAFTVAAVGYGLNYGFLAIERRLLHWHVAHERAAA